MLEFPRGLFILKESAKLNIENINGLIDISGQLKRKIDIITDIKINEDLFDGVWTRRLVVPQPPYNYILVADNLEMAYNNYIDVEKLTTKNHWTSYILPISDNPINYQQASNIKNNILTIGYDAVMMPMVTAPIGGNMFVLFNKDSILTQVDTGKHDIIWGNIFRACGCFNAKVKWEEHELSSI